MGGKFRFFVPIFIILFSASGLFADIEIPVKIKADSLSYINAGARIVASGNVKVTHQDFKINANQLVFDTDTNEIIGRGNVSIFQGGIEVVGHSFRMKLLNQQFQITEFHTELYDQKLDETVFVKSIDLIVSENLRMGHGLNLTSCDFDEPHWWMTAKEFRYYPDSHIEGFHVFVHFVFLPIPAAYFPYYQFQLGKRRLILKMPMFGSNNFEGTFIKNEVMYFIDEETEGSIYIDRMSNLGWGAGVRHKYKLDDLPGEIYYFGAEDTNTVRENYILKLKQKFKLIEDVWVDINYKTADMYKMLGGRVNLENYALNFDHHNDYRSLKTNVAKNRDKTSGQLNQNLNISHTQDTLKTNFTLNESFNPRMQSNETRRYKLSHAQAIANDYYLSTNFDMFSNKSIAEDPDEELNSQITFTHSPSNAFYKSLKVEQAWFLDLDEDTVTKDSRKEFIDKLPEVTMAMNPFSVDLGETNLFSFSQHYQFGNYRQSKALTGTDKNYIIESQRLAAEYTLGKAIDIPLGNKLNVKESYVQRFYDTGDQNYLLKHDPSFTTAWFDSFKNTISYSRHEFKGGSAFYFDKLGVDTETGKDKLTLYREKLFNWDFNWGKNIKFDRMDDFTTNLKITPFYPAMTFSFSTGWSYVSQRHRDLISRVTFKPSDKLNFSFDARSDANNGKLLSAGTSLRYTFGKTKREFAKNEWGILESEWSVAITHRYIVQSKEFKMMNLQVIKDLHDFIMSASYDESLKQYLFILTMKIAPDYPISAHYGEQGAGIEAFQSIIKSRGVERYE